jgi:hypothetical protein
VPDWHFAKASPSEKLSQLSFFSMLKKQGDREIEFRITVKEYIDRPGDLHHRFFAEADKHVNQKTAPVLPCGWGNSELEALSGCLGIIRQFPYEE